MYRDGLAARMRDIGGLLYNFNSDGSRSLYMTINGEGYTRKVVGYEFLGTQEKVEGSPLDAVGTKRETIYEYTRVVANQGGTKQSQFSSFDKAGYIVGTFGSVVGATEEGLAFTVRRYASGQGLRATARALGVTGARALSFADVAGRRLGIAGIGITVVDRLSNGFKGHHYADIGIGILTTFVTTNPLGFAVGTAYFFTDMVVKAQTGKSITEHIFDG